MFGAENVISQRHLRNAQGKIVGLVGDAIKLGKTKGSRILDFVVKTKNGWKGIEVTSKTASKVAQSGKEEIIRAAGGGFVRHPETKELIELSDDISRLIRLNQQGGNAMNSLRFNYSALLKRSKNLSYREQITNITTVLMIFLKKNKLVTLEPFKEDGTLKEDLVLYSSDLTDIGNLLFKEYYPKWSEYIDRGGDVNNIKILNDGLNLLKAR